MYLEHFQLKTKPFQISADPKFLWLGENHKEALAILKYGILDNRGFLLLTGDVGTGKTTLINALLNGLGNEVIAASVPDPGLSILDFLNYIAGAFGIKKRFTSKGDFLLYFKYFLEQAYQKNKKVLLIVDESQRLSHELLEEIRLLSNIEKQNQKLINIFFIGQNEFNDLLWEPRNRALRQRITINYNVYALTEKEVGEYIRHRLKIAGTEKTIFTAEAIKGIMQFSEGFPRMINIICDHALLTGFVKGVTMIGPGVIRECIADLQIPRKQETQSEEKELLETPKEIFADLKNVEHLPPKEFQNIISRQGMAIVVTLLLIIGIVLFFFIKGPNNYLESLSRYWETLFSVSQKIKEDAFQDHEQEIDQTNIIHSLNKDIIEFFQRSQEDTVPLHLIRKNDTQEKTLVISQGDRKSPGRGIFHGRAVLNFAHNSNEITMETAEMLNGISLVLLGDSALRLKVVGYTDSSGVYSYNKNLSLFRANIVKNYLIQKGVNPAQVAAIGMGSEDPLEDNTTPQGRKLNRRVEIEFIKSQLTAQP